MLNEIRTRGTLAPAAVWLPIVATLLLPVTGQAEQLGGGRPAAAPAIHRAGTEGFADAAATGVELIDATAGPASLLPATGDGAVVMAAGADGAAVRIRPVGAFLRHRDGTTTDLGAPLPVWPVPDGEGSLLHGELYRGVSVRWSAAAGSVAHEVVLEGDPGGLTPMPGDALVLEWEVSEAHSAGRRVFTEVALEPSPGMPVPTGVTQRDGLADLLREIGMGAQVGIADRLLVPPGDQLAGCIPSLEEAQLLAPDGRGGEDSPPADWFGISVALSGDTAAVGSHRHEDAGPHVYLRGETGWSWQTQLNNPDDLPSDDEDFGNSVALETSTLVTGASADDVGGKADAGSAWTFVHSGTAWTAQQRLVASDVAKDARFGASVALSGDTAVVGAYGWQRRRGAAYVFVRTGSTWTQQARLLASDGRTDDHFGISVAISGNTVVVGAYGDTHGSITRAGSVYVFVRSGTTWTQQAKLVPPGLGYADGFGRSVAVLGDTLVAGAPDQDAAPWTDVGSAYVYVRTGTTWSQQAKIGSPGVWDQQYFGSSVALATDRAVIGAVYLGHSDQSGRAYVFDRTGTTWSQVAEILASDGSPNDNFGCSVAISGDRLIVGARLDDTAAGPDAGSAYIFACPAP